MFSKTSKEIAHDLPMVFWARRGILTQTDYGASTNTLNWLGTRHAPGTFMLIPF
jgi:hypothetical protein